MNIKTGITIAGSLLTDVFYKIETYPIEGNLTNIQEVEYNIGGSGNLILDLAKLDSELKINVSSLIGDDSSGEMLYEKLSGYENVSLDGLIKDGRSSITLVMNAQDTKQRTFFFLPSSSDLYCEEYINWNKINTKIFHLEYLLLMAKIDEKDNVYGTHGAKILYEAQKRGMITSIDVVSKDGTRAKEIVCHALKYTDICCFNEIEAQTTTGILMLDKYKNVDKWAKDTLECLKTLGVSTWAVIHMPECGYGYDYNKKIFLKIPSFKLPKGFIKGTNGAGDAYCSGILYGAYKDFDLKKAMVLATACAACSLSYENGIDGIKPIEETWRFAELYL
ncbi:MAG: carbohydrate kinase family protein [Lachnospirales bacterium]